MFSSNINNGDYESIFHNNNPNSKQDQEDPHSTFLHFPSPFLHLEDEEFFLLQHHDLLRVPDNNTVEEAQIVANMADSVKDSNKNINNNIVPTSDICNNENKKKMMMIQTPTSSEQIPRKSSKRDRHSKINTARGPRDRRMRLSLEVARTFFNLQDMLGFDKASRTVDWLLRKSEAAIKEIARGLGLAHINHHRSCSTASSTSDCDVVSGIDEVFPINKEKTSSFVTKEKKIRQSRKAAFNPLARESREKARARARERTREKMWSRSQKLDESKLSDQDHSNQLNSWSSLEAGEESGGTTQNMNISKDAVGEAEDQPISTQKRSTEEMVEDSLVIMGEWSPSSMYNYLHNSGIPQEHQFGELSILWQTMGAGLQQS